MDVLGLHVMRCISHAALINEQGDVLQSASVEGGDPLAALADAARQARGERTVAAIAVAVDPSDALDAAALKAVLAELGHEGDVHIVNAGAAAVSVEAWKGAARGTRHAICLWIGETVFAGILLDGTPWTGAHGFAGSAAWLALNPVERQDYRKFGSLAAEVSNKGIARRLAWRIQAGDNSAVLERAGDVDVITAAHVYEGARSGDGVSISVVRDTAKYIGMAVANLASAIDPEVVVISGPVAAYGDLLMDPVRQECTRRLLPAMVDRFRCEVSPLEANAVAIGAAHLASLPRS